MSSATTLIAFAQEYLQSHPVDVLHDYAHHNNVRENFREIIFTEHIQVDEDALVCAAWWHDIEKTVLSTQSSASTISFLETTAKRLHSDSSLVKKVVKIISEHSFEEFQTITESKILFDADKVEYVNSERLENYIRDIDQHPDQYSRDQIMKQYTTWKERIPLVVPKLHYQWSRTHYLSNSENVVNELENLRHFFE